MHTAELVHLRYTLSRMQRFTPLVRRWGRLYTSFVVLLFTFFTLRAAVGLYQLEWLAVVGFGGLASFVWLLCAELFGGLVNIARLRAATMDVTIEESPAGDGAFGILGGPERWYLFLDGITRIERFRPDVWTITHWNGTILNIAANAVTEEQLDYIRAAMERGRTPEGVAAVVERGRKIQALLDAEKPND